MKAWICFLFNLLVNPLFGSCLSREIFKSNKWLLIGLEFGLSVKLRSILHSQNKTPTYRTPPLEAEPHPQTGESSFSVSYNHCKIVNYPQKYEYKHLWVWFSHRKSYCYKVKGQFENKLLQWCWKVNLHYKHVSTINFSGVSSVHLLSNFDLFLTTWW